MTLLSRFASTAFVMSALTLVMGPARLSATSIPPVTYVFTGVCSDCAGDGVGVLTLQNYTLGTAFSTSNFVSFYYFSNLISYSIPSSSDVTVFTGSLPTTLPASSVVDIQDTSDPTNVLITIADGAWCSGTNCAGDRGATSSFALAPEPATLILFPSAVLGIGLLRRRRARRA
jgi:hypothetical protein